MMSDASRLQSSLARYSIAVLLAAAGIGLRVAASPLFGPRDVPFIFAFPAVAAAAWFGGFGPSILCGALSSVLADVFLMSPEYSVVPSTVSQWLSLGAFALGALIIAFLGGRAWRALEELRQETRGTLAAIIQSSSDAIISKDLKGIITSWNEGASNLFGYTADEIVGRSIRTLIPEELYEEDDRILSAVRHGQRTAPYETVRLRKGGQRIEVSVSVSPIRSREGKIVGASKIARDITERRKAEQALKRTEMEAAKGRLAAIIAHEINNPLEAVTNVGYLIALAPELSPETREFVGTLNSEVLRVSEITRQALAFYRETSHPSPVSVNDVVSSVVELFRGKLNQRSIRVALDLKLEIPAVLVRAGELRQVVANLVSNAMDATLDQGAIRIRTRSASQFVRITVSDSGTGISSDRVQLIFRPFETTKGEKGTGLGLWVSKEIVERYGGKLIFRSTKGKDRQGTTFMILLPRTSEDELEVQAS